MGSAALMAFAATACGATVDQPRDPHGQISELVTKENHNHSRFGHLAPGITDVKQLETLGDAEATPSRDAVVDHLGATKDLRLFPLAYVRSTASEICFEKRLGIGSDEERKAEADSIGKEWSFVAAGHASLDEIAPGTKWPAPGPSTTNYKAEDRVLEVCMPAPALAPATRFLTVSVVSRNHDYNSYILVWDFTGKLKE